MNPDQLQLLLSDRDGWQRWRQENHGAHIDLRDAQLSKQNLARLNFGFRGIFILDDDEVVPHRSQLQRVNFNGSKLAGAEFSQARLDDAQFGGADLEGAVLADVVAPSAMFRRIRGANAKFYRADLRGCDFTGAKLPGAGFDACDFSGANLDGADLTNASFADVRLNRTTVLDRVTFSIWHDELADGTDRIILPHLDRFLNWARLRFISEIPLFGISYVGIVLALLLGHAIGFANEEVVVPLRTILDNAVEALDNGVAALRGSAGGEATVGGEQLQALASVLADLSALLPGVIRFPKQLTLAIVSTLLLAAGSTIYKFMCPDSVQRFGWHSFADLA